MMANAAIPVMPPNRRAVALIADPCPRRSSGTLEDLTDTITAIAARVDAHLDATAQVKAARRAINELPPPGAT